MFSSGWGLRAFLLFLRVGQPALLLGYAASSLWLVTFQLAFFELVVPAFSDSSRYWASSVAPGAAVFFVSLFLWIAWVLPITFVVVRGNFVVPLRPRYSGTKEFMQVARMDWPARRWCMKCGAPQGDRVYHCSEGFVDACLPLFDHHCGFLNSAIYLYNKKAYLLSLPPMVLHMWCSFGVTIWAWTQPEYRWMARYFPVVAVAFLFSVFLCYVTYEQWRYQGLRNGLMQEVDEVETSFLMVQTGSQPVYCDFGVLHLRPWDLGWSQNIKAAFGSKKDWFLFFVKAPQVVYWESDTESSDWPVGDAARAIQRAHQTRAPVPLAQSSGYGADRTVRSRLTSSE